MVICYVEASEVRKTKRGDDFIFLNVNTGEERLQVYVWNPTTPITVGMYLNLDNLKRGEYNTIQSTEIKILKREIIPEEHPVLKIQTEGLYGTKELWEEWCSIVNKTVKDEDWKEFMLSDLIYKSILPYENFPAGKSIHHSYNRGLSTHVMEVIQSVARVAYFPMVKDKVDIVVLLLSALFHDWGKMQEYKQQTEQMYEYTENLPLLGHIYISARYVNDLIEVWFVQKEKMDDTVERKMKQIIHCILAHHGTKEWGSPVVPATLEALILHQMDILSGKIQHFEVYNNMEKSFWFGTFLVK